MPDALSIRPLHRDDIERLKSWTRNPHPIFCGYNYEDLTKWEGDQWFRSKKHCFAEYFAIDCAEKRLIGFLGAKNINYLKGKAILGIVMDAKYQSKGLGSLALKQFLDHYFSRRIFRSIELDVNQFNHRAIHVYEKMGFTIIGEDYELFEDQHIRSRCSDWEQFEPYFFSNDGYIYARLYRMRLKRDAWT